MEDEQQVICLGILNHKQPQHGESSPSIWHVTEMGWLAEPPWWKVRSEALQQNVEDDFPKQEMCNYKIWVVLPGPEW